MEMIHTGVNCLCQSVTGARLAQEEGERIFKLPEAWLGVDDVMVRVESPVFVVKVKLHPASE